MYLAPPAFHLPPICMRMNVGSMDEGTKTEKTWIQIYPGDGYSMGFETRRLSRSFSILLESLLNIGPQIGFTAIKDCKVSLRPVGPLYTPLNPSDATLVCCEAAISTARLFGGQGTTTSKTPQGNLRPAGEDGHLKRRRGDINCSRRR